MDTRQCSAVVFGERVTNWPCQRKGIVQREGKWYCRQHDPVAVKARRAARHQKYLDERAADDQIEREGDALAKRLGYGRPHWSPGVGNRPGGMRRELLITFEEAEEIIARLKAMK